MSKTSVTSDLPHAFGEPPLSKASTPAGRKRDESVLMEFFRALASLKFTVVLFALSILLVLFGTLAQVDEGIWTVVGKYFRWFYVWVPLQIFFPRAIYVWGGFPFPGGLTLGSLLMVNLLAAHALRFKFTLKRSGIILLHAGLIVMMLGELITGQFAVEANMTIETGTTVNYVEERGSNELAVIRHLDAKTDDVVVVPGKKLKHARAGEKIQHADLPFDIQVDKYMVNSAEPEQDGQGIWIAAEKPEGTGVDAEQRIDMASAYVTLFEKGTDHKLGKHLVSVWFSALTDQPQKITVDGKEYDIYLRFKRTYKPYSITLKKFEHDVYDGTNTPKNFASTIVLSDPSRKNELETKISMNAPLRYNGETFYQSGFLPRDQGTILQVVRNPAWQMPYLSCLMVTLGMLIHFSITLWGFLRKQIDQHARQLDQRAKIAGVGAASDFSAASWILPGLVVGFALVYIVIVMNPPQDPPGAMRLHDFGKLPIIDRGRTKPIQTAAMNDLLMVSNKRTFKGTDGEYHDALKWFLDVMTSGMNKNGDVEDYEVFRIDNDQVLNLLGLKIKPEFLKYSVREIAPKFEELIKEATRAEKVERDKRTLFDIKVLELAERVQVYSDLAQMRAPNMVPPRDGQPSKPLAEAVPEMMRKLKAKNEADPPNPDVIDLYLMLHAYEAKDTKTFNDTLDQYHARLEQTMPVAVKKAEFESFFNDFEPFFHCTALYLCILVLGCGSWIGFRTPLLRSAFCLCVLTFLVHAWAIGARMWIQDRPPITNLYSTAIFIGCACVLLGIIVETIFRNGFGVVMAGTIGFLTTIIAHNLSTDGDTMEMMQAVLDTNFWLATHVVIINLGYAATLAAGFMGIAFILAGLLQRITGILHRDTFLALNRILYGILCFATLTSFVGTMLGGIWADQSWGRFWGWDPKENGALMIVIMNALILHARWGGIVQQRGIAVLSLVSNCIVAWSWFGVNLLGVGLHAYAGQQGTLIWLVLFCLSQVGLMIVGVLPFMNCWKTAGVTKVNLPPPDSPLFKKRRK